MRNAGSLVQMRRCGSALFGVRPLTPALSVRVRGRGGNPVMLPAKLARNEPIRTVPAYRLEATDLAGFWGIVSSNAHRSSDNAYGAIPALWHGGR
jgi:hypothetical protein